MKKKTFEQAFLELENLVSKIENENLELEELLKYYQKSCNLIDFCEKLLLDTKQKITNIK